MSLTDTKSKLRQLKTASIPLTQRKTASINSAIIETSLKRIQQDADFRSKIFDKIRALTGIEDVTLAHVREYFAQSLRTESPKKSGTKKTPAAKTPKSKKSNSKQSTRKTES